MQNRLYAVKGHTSNDMFDCSHVRGIVSSLYMEFQIQIDVSYREFTVHCTWSFRYKLTLVIVSSLYIEFQIQIDVSYREFTVHRVSDTD